MMAPSNERPVTRLFRVWSRFYDNPVPQRLFYRRVHARILQRYRPKQGERVLDVGDPRLAVLLATPDAFRATVVRVR